jgi:hypothetical protein
LEIQEFQIQNSKGKKLDIAVTWSEARVTSGARKNLL